MGGSRILNSRILAAVSCRTQHRCELRTLRAECLRARGCCLAVLEDAGCQQILERVCFLCCDLLPNAINQRFLRCGDELLGLDPT
eukprot:2733193-Rhodomonas_salina.5